MEQLTAIDLLTGVNAVALLWIVWLASAWKASIGSRVDSLEQDRAKRVLRDEKMFDKLEELHVDLAALSAEVNGLGGRFDRMDERR